MSRVLAVLALTFGLVFSSLGVQTATAEQQAGKMYHTFVKTRIVKKANGDLYFRTKVRNYPDRLTYLEKKTCKRCTWRQVAKKRTTKHSIVKYPVGAPRNGRWYWRIKTPATKRFYVSYSDVWYTYTV